MDEIVNCVDHLYDLLVVSFEVFFNIGLCEFLGEYFEGVHGKSIGFWLYGNRWWLGGVSAKALEPFFKNNEFFVVCDFYFFFKYLVLLYGVQSLKEFLFIVWKQF